jgi:hypothetical protein
VLGSDDSRLLGACEQRAVKTRCYTSITLPLPMCVWEQRSSLGIEVAVAVNRVLGSMESESEGEGDKHHDGADGSPSVVVVSAGLAMCV